MRKLLAWMLIILLSFPKVANAATIVPCDALFFSGVKQGSCIVAKRYRKPKALAKEAKRQGYTCALPKKKAVWGPDGQAFCSKLKKKPKPSIAKRK